MTGCFYLPFSNLKHAFTEKAIGFIRLFLSEKVLQRRWIVRQNRPPWIYELNTSFVFVTSIVFIYLSSIFMWVLGHTMLNIIDNIILWQYNLIINIIIIKYNSFETVLMHMKSSDAKASKCHLKFFSLMTIFIKLVYLSSVISLK